MISFLFPKKVRVLRYNVRIFDYKFNIKFFIQYITQMFVILFQTIHDECYIFVETFSGKTWVQDHL